MQAARDRTLFRSMEVGEGAPTLGSDDLGVRIKTDITPDNAGQVYPNAGGMSVAPDDPINLHRLHRPPSLGGSGTKPVWAIQRSTLPDTLVCRPDTKGPTKHAVIEPAMIMEFDVYVAAIEGTAPNWTMHSA